VREHRAFFRRPGCLLALAVLAAIPALATWKICDELRPWYTHEVLLRLSSPTGAWTAVVSEDTVEAPLSTSINAHVDLISRERPNEPIELLGIDTGGDQGERPRIAWSAPNILRVTVPNVPYLTVLTRQADGVQVDIQFDPDDPAARAAWLKQMGLSPDGP